MRVVKATSRRLFYGKDIYLLNVESPFHLYASLEEIVIPIRVLSLSCAYPKYEPNSGKKRLKHTSTILVFLLSDTHNPTWSDCTSAIRFYLNPTAFTIQTLRWITFWMHRSIFFCQGGACIFIFPRIYIHPLSNPLSPPSLTFPPDEANRNRSSAARMFPFLQLVHHRRCRETRREAIETLKKMLIAPKAPPFSFCLHHDTGLSKEGKRSSGMNRFSCKTRFTEIRVKSTFITLFNYYPWSSSYLSLRPKSAWMD